MTKRIPGDLVLRAKPARKRSSPVAFDHQEEYPVEKEISGERTRRAKPARRADQLLCGRPAGGGGSRIGASAQADAGRRLSRALRGIPEFPQNKINLDKYRQIQVNSHGSNQREIKILFNNLQEYLKLKHQSFFEIRR
ncbi:MAG: hypothetical protein OXG62_08355 [Nitrospinae bacterium]|nr:hypothetical protein [Nitrospinota bacterium]